MTDRILSVRVSGSLHEIFNRSMVESGTNASEFLREAIKKQVEGMVPGPQWTDPVEQAKSVLNDENYLGAYVRLANNENGDTVEISNEDWLRNLCKRLALTVLRQDELLRKFESLAEKSTNERGNIIQEFTETGATA